MIGASDAASPLPRFPLLPALLIPDRLARLCLQALLFWNLHADGSMDPHSLHSGCPVVQGNKWSATKWIRVGKHTVWT
jgi:hypothetical protein